MFEHLFQEKALRNCIMATADGQYRQTTIQRQLRTLLCWFYWMLFGWMWTYYRVDNWYHNNAIIIEATYYQVNKIVNNNNGSSSSSTRHDTLTYTPQNTQHIFIHAHTQSPIRENETNTLALHHTHAYSQVTSNAPGQTTTAREWGGRIKRNIYFDWMFLAICIASKLLHFLSLSIRVSTYLRMLMMSLYLNVLWLRFFGRKRDDAWARACKQISCEQQFIKIKCEFYAFCVRYKMNINVICHMIRRL